MAEQPQPQTVTFVYEKAADYSVRYADGAILSLMPNGNLHLSFFLERVPYFKELTHAINSDGGLGEEISRKLEADGVCRHQQVGIVLTPLAAENTAKFILETLENIKKAEADARAAKKGK